MVHVLTVSSITFKLKISMIVWENMHYTIEVGKERIHVEMESRLFSGLLFNLVCIAYRLRLNGISEFIKSLVSDLHGKLVFSTLAKSYLLDS